jgi:HEXXH motif-containing protein
MSIDPSLAAQATRLDPAYATALQGAVIDKLARQTEEVVMQAATAEGDAFAAMLALLALPEAERRPIMLHPSFRFWVQAMRRTSLPECAVAQQDLLRRLSGFVWAAPSLRGRAARGWRLVTDDRGGLRCPASGRHVELGETHADEMIEAFPEAEEIVLRCDDGLTVRVPYGDLDGEIEEPLPNLAEHGYRLTVSPRVAQGRIEIGRRDPWLRVTLTGTNQRTDGVAFFGVDDEPYPERPDLGALTGALDLIAALWPEQYCDLAEFTRVIVPIAPAESAMPPAPVAAGPGQVHCAFTVSSRQGALYLGAAPVDATVEMLLHENAHIKLRQAQAIDPLLRDPLDESVRLPVPWRPDPRPIPGILEGLFVFAHVQEFETRRWRVAPGSVPRDRLAGRLADLRYAADCLAQRAVVTPAGAAFLARMQEWLAGLQAQLDGTDRQPSR